MNNETINEIKGNIAVFCMGTVITFVCACACYGIQLLWVHDLYVLAIMISIVSAALILKGLAIGIIMAFSGLFDILLNVIKLSANCLAAKK